MRILWMDTETGGLEAGYHEMLTIAGIVEIDKEIVNEFHFKIKPKYPDRLEPAALEYNNLTEAQVVAFEDPFNVFYKLKKIFVKYGLRYDKLICAGHNVGFDRRFLNAFFEEQGYKQLHYYLDYHSLDTMSVAAWLRYVGKLDIKNLKLSSLCQHFGIDFEAHDALEDIRATRELAHRLQKLL